MTKTGGSRPRPDKVAESRHPGQAGGGPGIDRRIIEQSTVPENVTVSVAFPETLPPLRVDPLQTQQALRNLISNAVQAMRGGGRLRIAAKSVRCSLSDAVSFK
jgi:signal transduction histidine kinase